MNLNDSGRIKFAIPSKGRLMEPTIDLLKKSGFKFRAQGRNLYATCTNYDIVFIFIRADDIPVLVDSGVVDLGITGSDLIQERMADVDHLLHLGYGQCRLCVAVKDEWKEESLESLTGINIATSFPVMTTEYFKKQDVNVNCIEMNGSVEIMIALNLAQAIVDIVETGDSLRDNNLKVFKEIGLYETTLIASKKIAGDERVTRIKRRIEGVLVANHYSMLEYNIHESRLKEAEKITPGFESPTVSRLDEKEWLAVKVMVKKSEVVQVMDRLEALGATAIIETEIMNCRL
ncbi:MAG TPA: ATP phosphoribosyltransferase [Spirochaetota bacterium]|nr:ATP phosphoribosyltransferase [Spirochaetota bacterium]HQO39915.1 ATP phosphoribosyltransferase [Spirochaetota bacterium]